MTNKLLIIAFLLLVGISSKAQKLYYDDYDWDGTPKLHKLTEQEQKEKEVILKDKYAMEFAYSETGDLIAYSLIHKIIKVNTDDAIEANNKIYLPYSDNSQVIRQKVRVITTEGKIIKLGAEDIKESKDEETESVLKYFALEGLDKGSEIEYYFYVQVAPNFLGAKRVLQSDVVKKNVEVEIISPKNLLFVAKTYNGLPEMIIDSSDSEYNLLTLKLDEIKPLKHERFSNYDANLQMLVYKLDENVYAKKNNLVNYKDASVSLYNNIYQSFEKGDEKKIDKLISEINIPKNATEEEKILAVEQFIKTKYVLLEYHPEFQTLATVIEKKVGDEQGITKLFAAIFTKLGIDLQLVLTTNRFDIKFDPKFEAYNFLDTYLLYFPKLNKYLSPGAQISRLGFIPAGYYYNYGLFIRSVEVGDYKSGVGEIKFIEAPSYLNSTDNLDIETSFSPNILDAVYTIKREQTGYYAIGNQPYYDYFDIEQKKKSTEEIVKFMSQDAVVSNVKIENEGTINFPTKPFIVNATFKANKFIEKAGSKYLFKVGELIGPQAELYQEDARVTEAENGFNRRYHRIIKFTIPDGYVCNNFDAINFQVVQDIDGERTTQFISSYKTNGNQVEIDIEEYYNRIIYSIDQFENFRSVVNAAADFNKVVLVFEQK